MLQVQVGARKCFKCGKKGHIGKDCPKLKPIVQSDVAKQPETVAQPHHSRAPLQSASSIGSTNKRRRVEDTVEDESDAFTSDFEVSEVNTSGTQESQTLPKPKKNNRKNVSAVGAKPSSQAPKDPWGHERWKDVNIEVKSVTRERLYIFLRSLRKDNNNLNYPYSNLAQNLFLTSKNIEDVHSLFVEVHSLLPSSMTVVRQRYSSLIKQVGEVVDLDQDDKDKIIAQLDPNYRTFEWQGFCKQNNISSFECENFKKFFFNIKWP